MEIRTNLCLLEECTQGYVKAAKQKLSPASLHLGIGPPLTSLSTFPLFVQCERFDRIDRDKMVAVNIC